MVTELFFSPPLGVIPATRWLFFWKVTPEPPPSCYPGPSAPGPAVSPRSGLALSPPRRPRSAPAGQGTQASFARGEGPGGPATLSRPQGGTGLGRETGNRSSLTIPSPAAAAGVNDGAFRKAEGALWRGRAANDRSLEASNTRLSDHVLAPRARERASERASAAPVRLSTWPQPVSQEDF